MASKEINSDVLVIGGGMVGAAAALGLAQRGYQVAVLEPKPVTQWLETDTYDLRISAVTSDNIALLEELGVWELIHDMRAQPFNQLAVREAGSDWLELGEAGSLQPLGYMIENNLLQFSLWQALQAHPQVTTLCSSLQTLNTEEQQAITGDADVVNYQWLLGCDGANSRARQLSGIGVGGRDYGQSCLLTLVKTESQVAPRTWESFQGDEIHALLPLSDKQACLILYADTPTVKHWQANETRLHEVLQARFAESVGAFTLLNWGSFPLRRQSALHYVKDRTILLGDAAHSIHPMAGQGVNLGFRDVKKLLQVMYGQELEHAPALGVALKRFEIERRADNELMAHAMDSIGWGFKTEQKGIQLLRRGLLSGLRKFTPGQRLMTAYASGVWKL
ncbi:FAD-dependent oxidoreductase [Aliidiomarina sp. Khilg15.8]